MVYSTSQKEKVLYHKCMLTEANTLRKRPSQGTKQIEFEEQVQLLMYDTFSALVSDILSEMNQVIKEQKNWTSGNNLQKECRSFPEMFVTDERSCITKSGIQDILWTNDRVL